MKKILYAVVMTFVLVSSVSAQRYENQIHTQLNEKQGSMSQVFRQTGVLAEDGSEIYSVTLRANQRYIFRGVCDEDCTDVDLYLYDKDLDLVSSDTETDDYPLISISPYTTQTYYIKVKIADCDGVCYFGVAAFI